MTWLLVVASADTTPLATFARRRALACFIFATKAHLKETRTGLDFTGSRSGQLAKRGVRTPDALEAYRNPLQRGPIRLDEFGQPRQNFIGRDATIVLNPETNRIITGYPTSTRIRNRLLRQLRTE